MNASNLADLCAASLGRVPVNDSTALTIWHSTQNLHHIFGFARNENLLAPFGEVAQARPLIADDGYITGSALKAAHLAESGADHVCPRASRAREALRSRKARSFFGSMSVIR